LVPESNAIVVPGLGKLGIKPDDFVISLYGFIVLALVIERITFIVLIFFGLLTLCRCYQCQEKNERGTHRSHRVENVCKEDMFVAIFILIEYLAACIGVCRRCLTRIKKIKKN